MVPISGFLALSPVEKLKKADTPDTGKHGHAWPDYYYYYCYYYYCCYYYHYYHHRGCMMDDRGTDVAVARALVDWKTEFPDATILGDV
jgi:hypothetical protein